MKMSVGRWPEIHRPLFGLCRRFVGQPSPQTFEWSDIVGEIVGVLVIDFSLDEDLGN